MFIEQINLWAFPWSFDEGQKHDQSAIIMEGLLASSHLAQYG